MIRKQASHFSLRLKRLITVAILFLSGSFCSWTAADESSSGDGKQKCTDLTVEGAVVSQQSGHGKLMSLEETRKIRERLPGLDKIFNVVTDYFLKYEAANSQDYLDILSGGEASLGADEEGVVEIKLRDGSLFRIRGQELNRELLRSIPAGVYEFVIPKMGVAGGRSSSIFVGTGGHEVFGVSRVWAAGEVLIDGVQDADNGEDPSNRLVAISLKSGHFTPNFAAALQVVVELFLSGIFPDEITVGWQSFHHAAKISLNLVTGEHDLAMAERFARALEIRR